MWSSDAPTEDSERDGLSVEEHSDAIDDDLNSCSMNQLDTVGTCNLIYILLFNSGLSSVF